MRKDDPTGISRSFRSPDRFFKANGHWYFAAREGEIGPFRNRQQAEREAAAYIRARQTALRARLQQSRPKETAGRAAPDFVYRCILSMEPRVEGASDLILDASDRD